MGEMGSIEPITEVIVNGQKLDGYLDIGLIDTMLDMMICFIGSLGFCLQDALRKKPFPQQVVRCERKPAKAES